MLFTTAKRPRPSDTPVETHSFKMVKRARPANDSPVGSPACQDSASKYSNLISAYGPLALCPRFITSSHSVPLPQVELLPTPSFAFVGMSPITSFLASSSHTYLNVPLRVSPEGEENIGQCEIREEQPNYKIFRSVNEVPYSMLYDNVTPEK